MVKLVYILRFVPQTPIGTPSPDLSPSTEPYHFWNIPGVYARQTGTTLTNVITCGHACHNDGINTIWDGANITRRLTWALRIRQCLLLVGCLKTSPISWQIYVHCYFLGEYRPIIAPVTLCYLGNITGPVECEFCQITLISCWQSDICGTM